MNKPDKPISAVIFDMDDLMIHSHPINMKIIEEVLNMYGASLKGTFTIEEEIKNSGLKISDYFQYLIEKYGLQNKANSKTLTLQYDELTLPIFSQTNIEPMPGLLSLIKSLKRNNYKLAIASSSKKEKIDIVIKKLCIEEYFISIVSGEDHIEHGKPSPDIFLLAAKNMGVAPTTCLVFEDAENGVKAAKAAGMYAIGIHNKFNKEKLGMCQNLDQADIQFDSLEEVTLEVINSLA